MYIEFALELRQALIKLGFEPDLALASKGPLSPQKYSALEIEPSPSYVDALLSSRVAYKLASRMSIESKASDGRSCSPTVIAENILRVLNADGSGKFKLEIGGGAHLNVTASGEFEVLFFKQILGPRPDLIFTGGSIFSKCLALSFTWDFSEVWNRVASAEGELPFAKDSWRDRLMLTSLLSDRELDPKFYRQGLYERENTPWYLERFFFDLRRSFEEGSSQTFPISEIGDLNHYAEISPSFRLIASFRHELFMSELTAKPERLLARVLWLVRDFYRLFNQPRYRGSAKTKERAMFSLVNQLRWGLVLTSLECLFGEEVKELLR